MTVSGELHYELHGFRELPPGGALARELAAAGSGDLVKLRAAAELGHSPFGLDEAFLLEPVERWVERALVHAQRLLRDLLDAMRHGPPVHWLAGERAEDEEVERALKELVGWEGHRDFDELLSADYTNTVMLLL